MNTARASHGLAASGEYVHAIAGRARSENSTIEPAFSLVSRIAVLDSEQVLKEVVTVRSAPFSRAAANARP